MSLDDQAVVLTGCIAITCKYDLDLVARMIADDLRYYIQHMQISDNSNIIYDEVIIDDVTEATVAEKCYGFEDIISISDDLMSTYSNIAISSVVIMDENNLIIKLKEPKRWEE